MRTKHDNMCLWWKDWHNCSCGFLEEQVRNEARELSACINDTYKKFVESEICAQVIPNTFIMCGEEVGNIKQYCSDHCFKKAKG